MNTLKEIILAPVAIVFVVVLLLNKRLQQDFESWEVRTYGAI